MLSSHSHGRIFDVRYCRGTGRSRGFHALAPAHYGLRRHDDDLKPPICLDTFHAVLSNKDRRASFGCAMDDYDSDRLADLAFAAPRLSRGPVRAEAVDRMRGP